MVLLNGEKYRYVKPYFLQKENDFKLIKGVVIGSTLGWFIERKFISYNYIKSQLK